MPYIEHLNQPVDIDEIRQAVITGKRPKAPGSNGLGHDFYQVHWTTIKDELHCVLNNIYWNKAIIPTKTRRDRLPTQA